LDKKLEAFIQFTITDKNKLLTQLGKIRKNGVAFCKEEMLIGINTIGIPIFNHENKPIAAVVIAGPSKRVKCEINSSLVTALKKAAKEISSQLYHQISLEKD